MTDAAGLLESDKHIGQFETIATVLELELGHINVVYLPRTESFFSLLCISKNAAFNQSKTGQVMDNRDHVINLSNTSMYVSTCLASFADTSCLFLLYKEIMICNLRWERMIACSYFIKNCIYPLLHHRELLSEGPMEELSVRFFMGALVLGLGVVLDKGIQFRGISSDKIMVDSSGLPLLTDFKLSKSHPGRSFTLCGTPDYMPPEMLTNKGADYSGDLWALGVLAYEMLNGCMPFSNDKTTGRTEMKRY